MLSSRLARPASLVAALTLSAALVACSNGEEEAPVDPAPETTAESTAEETTSEVTSSEESSSEESSAEESEESASESASSEEEEEPDDEVDTELMDEVYETFAPVMSKKLFDQFDTCTEGSVNDSYFCSGREVGQFQFHKSKSKASQTTQVLTGLRSATAVEDDGNRVVGWSTLGSTIILSVVDNREGLVMQQLTNSDEVDPEERLAELDLLSND
ncbi:beta-N-acetylglucosaminidase [Corynebacterium camporealensis]